MKKTEDAVRDEARILLNFYQDKDSQCGVGQLTTFNQLGFKGFSDKPDGWYLPNNTSDVAIILETKNSDVDINKEFCKDELFKNIDIALQKYDRVIGILYNGVDVLVYKDKILVDLKKQLFTKEYYISLYNKNTINKKQIFSLTESINHNLHKNFGINNLYHRMIFTACALVAQRYNKHCLQKDMDWATLHTSILSTIKKSYESAKKQNQKLDLIAEQFVLIQCNYTENQNAINDFIVCIDQISASINSNYWNGEDVMAIFFNEFTRYKGKSEQGQVFTPDHITSLIYRITGTNYKDNLLDACCGSGAFLVKAMSYMINEVGGVNNEADVKKIKEERLFGVEFSKELYALACANMLIHKDGKTNLIQDDSRTKEVGDWIGSKKITKVLMNPPYENAYGCLEIVKNVLDNVEDGAICAFIMPDTKLSVGVGINWIKKIFNQHSLQKIIKLPDIFSGMAVVNTSIFIFKAHSPQNNNDIFACWIKDDGLETVKNKGRLDINNKWQDLENKWVEIIFKQSGDDSIQWIKPTEPIKYKTPEIEYVFNEKLFRSSVLEFLLFKNNCSDIIFKKDGNEILSNSYRVLKFLDGETNKCLFPNNQSDTTWDKFKIVDLFSVDRDGGVESSQGSEEGNSNLVIAAKYNNAVSSKKVKGQKSPFKGNRLTLVKNGDGAAGLAFYQEEEFYKTSSIIVLKSNNKNFKREHGLFIVTMMRKFKEEFNHDKGINDSELSKMEINLPSKKDLNNETIPDWCYMENYINEIIEQINNENILSINMSNKIPAKKIKP